MCPRSGVLLEGQGGDLRVRVLPLVESGGVDGQNDLIVFSHQVVGVGVADEGEGFALRGIEPEVRSPDPEAVVHLEDALDELWNRRGPCPSTRP